MDPLSKLVAVRRIGGIVPRIVRVVPVIPMRRLCLAAFGVALFLLQARRTGGNQTAVHLADRHRLIAAPGPGVTTQLALGIERPVFLVPGVEHSVWEARGSREEFAANLYENNRTGHPDHKRKCDEQQTQIEDDHTRPDRDANEPA